MVSLKNTLVLENVVVVNGVYVCVTIGLKMF